MSLSEPTYVVDSGNSSNFNVHDASKDENVNSENTNNNTNKVIPQLSSHLVNNWPYRKLK